MAVRWSLLLLALLASAALVNARVASQEVDDLEAVSVDDLDSEDAAIDALAAGEDPLAEPRFKADPAPVASTPAPVETIETTKKTTTTTTTVTTITPLPPAADNSTSKTGAGAPVSVDVAPKPVNVSIPALPTVPKETAPPVPPPNVTKDFPSAEPVPEPPMDLTGYDLLTSIVLRMRKNLALEQAASELDFQRLNEVCEGELSMYNKTIDKLEKELSAVEQVIDNAREQAATLEKEIASLQTLIEPKSKELAEVKNTLSESQVARAQETTVYFRKRNDTKVVLDAVQLIVDRLASGNVTTFRFRQQLFDAAARVSDPKVHSLLQTAMEAMAVVTNSPQDVTNLRRLLGLLVSELQSYSDILDKTEVNSAELFRVSSGQLQAQITLLNEAIQARQRQVDLKDHKLRQQRATEADAQVLQGKLPPKLERAKTRRDQWLADCTTRQNGHRMETADRAVQTSTLASLAQLLDFKDATTARVLAVATKDVRLPHMMVNLQGVRCCRVCRDGNKACGDKCVPEAETCPATQAAGCACNLEATPVKPASTAAPATQAQSEANKLEAIAGKSPFSFLEEEELADNAETLADNAL